MNRRTGGQLLLAGAIALDAWACWQLGGLAGATNDLYPRWLATRLWLTSGADPYGAATNSAIAEAMGSVPLGGDGAFVFGFVYPAYVALLLAPLALLPWRAAATLWLLGTQACALTGALCCWRAHEDERGLPRKGSAPAMLVTALFPATVLTLIFLQFSAVVFLGLSLGWLLLTRQRDRAAGAAMAICLVKLSVAVLPLAALLYGAVRRGRWRGPVALAVVGGAVGALSVILLPAWPQAFWQSTLDYASVTRAAAASGVLARLFGSSEPPLTGVLGLLAAGVILWSWIASRRAVGDSMQAGVLAGAWLVPPLYEWNNIVLLVVLVPLLREAVEAGPAAARAAVGGALAVSLLTAAAYTFVPGEARLIWPVIALCAYGAPAVLRLRGRYSATDGSAALPPSAARS